MDVEGGGVFLALLNPITDAVRIVLGLDQRQRNVRLVIQDLVGPLALAAQHKRFLSASNRDFQP